MSHQEIQSLLTVGPRTERSTKTALLRVIAGEPYQKGILTFLMIGNILGLV
jgi:hypothetical protein